MVGHAHTCLKIAWSPAVARAHWVVSYLLSLSFSRLPVCPSFWHCPHSMWSIIYESVRCPSLDMPLCPLQKRAADSLLWARRLGDIDRTGVNPAGDAGNTPNILVGGTSTGISTPILLRTFGYSRPILVALRSLSLKPISFGYKTPPIRVFPSHTSPHSVVRPPQP